jgi:hypothetical protein
VQVTVNQALATTSNYIKVNLYGGTNPYTNTTCNNWNILSSLTSATLYYADATASGVRAALSQRNGVNDNGAGYGGGMAPAEVLRYSCYSTAFRTLTLSGLSYIKTYHLELYASRAKVGYSTVFKIGSATQIIKTDSNKTVKAVFQNLIPSSGSQLVINISGLNTYNYINGFVLTEITENSSVITFTQRRRLRKQPGMGKNF